MPDVGEGLTEADILTWHVAPGDVVVVNQVLVEIETAKAAVELPSPWAGTVGELLAQPGETVGSGRPIIAIETAGAGPSAGAPGGRAVDRQPARPRRRRAVRSAGRSGPRSARPQRRMPGGPRRPPPLPRRPMSAGRRSARPVADGRIATLVGYGPRPGSVTRRPRRSPTAGPARRPSLPRLAPSSTPVRFHKIEA